MMVISINQQSRIPVFKQVTEEIKLKIASGDLRKGEKLPSVRELAVSLGVNPNTIMKSYKELEREGFVETKAGKGVFIKENLSDLTVNNLKKEILFRKIDEMVKTAKMLNIEKEEIISEINKRY
ncbi:GntR family transcriptional regulator [Thermotomaculum hydrothermale]|uniref:GntR family transcriptional regulator n=1 Tax=Thermotomaculum hydrothermale TaxID=981385 RepID=A0A7R6SY54_9BACT|nr:GntR family transcriptional regulator [Thermotomaculum hydrothermale]BBB32275.1 GntR family transcriptional regulator [Thermotomaculum hydrothermale]